MSLDLVLAFLGFAFVSSVTPGPNNMMLLASGVNFGLARTVPHILGINFGFPLMLLLVGLGLGQIFERFPTIYTTMKYGGAFYMLWLAWKIANSGAVGEGAAAARPISFLQAAAFQWVNPKAWAMVFGAIAAYTVPENFLVSMLMISGLYAFVGLPSSAVWAVFGTTMRGFLRDPKTVRLFNITMALLLVASLWPIVSEMLNW